MRPAAQVRLGRGGEPPGLISPTGVFACSRARQAPAPGSMLDPHDDTDVPSGSTDGAQMESTSSPVPRLHGDHEGSPMPTSSSSAPTAARTLDTAATEEPSFTVEAAAPSAQLQSPTPPSARPVARGSPGWATTSFQDGLRWRRPTAVDSVLHDPPALFATSAVALAVAFCSPSSSTA